jgi:uncharacterized protein YuzE
MKINYFEDTDTALIEFTNQEVAETREVSENVYLDLDSEGNLVSMTVEHASEKASIDTFRDILDQTPLGDKIDASLTKTLKGHQHALRVHRQVSRLLERYQTPKKAPIDLGTLKTPLLS